MSSIEINDVTLEFRVYHDAMPSIKDTVSNLFSKNKRTGFTTFKALDKITFKIEKGERVGIVGHNGAGKSTLLKTICKIYEPQFGNVKVNGKLAPLIEIGAGFHHEYTGRENIYLNGVILGTNIKKLKQIESQVIEFAGLEDFIDMPVKYYSTGMYMRLAFALATTIDPDILILDELFAGGDANFVTKASQKMTDLIDQSNIMVLVSHELGLLERFCNRVLWIDHGALKADGPADEILALYRKNEGRWVDGK